MRKLKPSLRAVGMAIALAVAAGPVTSAFAADKVRLIISTKRPFSLFGPNQALKQGYFKEEGLDVSLIYGSGGAATLQALVTASQDIAVGVGALSVLGTYAKGAPVVALGNSSKGAAGVYWYVPANSPIKSIQDLNGKQLAFSRPGSTTHLASQFLAKAYDLNVKLTSVGGISASRTQAMSGQVDTGWSSAPTGLGLVRDGKIRIVASSNDVKPIKDISTSVVAANSRWLKENRDVATRFMRAYWRGVLFHWFGGAPAIEHYAQTWKLNTADVHDYLDLIPFRTAFLVPVGGVEDLNKLAVDFKYIKEPLDAQKLAGFTDYIYDPRKDK